MQRVHGSDPRRPHPSDCCPPFCTAPTCTDGIQNADETGVDCGGSCSDCGMFQCPRGGSGFSSRACGPCAQSLVCFTFASSAPFPPPTMHTPWAPTYTAKHPPPRVAPTHPHLSPYATHHAMTPRIQRTAHPCPTTYTTRHTPHPRAPRMGNETQHTHHGHKGGGVHDVPSTRRTGRGNVPLSGKRPRKWTSQGPKAAAGERPLSCLPLCGLDTEK